MQDFNGEVRVAERKGKGEVDKLYTKAKGNKPNVDVSQTNFERKNLVAFRRSEIDFREKEFGQRKADRKKRRTFRQNERGNCALNM